MPVDIRDAVTLNNGVKMPWLGVGVFGFENGGDVERVVNTALEASYRSIDTASIYGNERGVGTAIQTSGVARDELFLTTKVWNEDQRRQRTRVAFEESLERLQTEYVDLYLVHWPVEGCFRQTWSELEDIYRSGRARAIGVSNFLPQHLDELLSGCRICPSVNQVELHPWLVQPKLREYCRSRGIQLEAWSPLMQGQVGDADVIVRLAAQHHKTPAQIVLRWHLQHEVVVIPRSGNADRIVENAQVFDFELSMDDMHELDALDSARRLGPSPEDFDF
jgi:diketogulonate reductase-like aldo/keto reductase